MGIVRTVLNRLRGAVDLILIQAETDCALFSRRDRGATLQSSHTQVGAPLT